MKYLEVSKIAKIRNRYNQVPHLTQDTNGKVTNSQLDESLKRLKKTFRTPYNLRNFLHPRMRFEYVEHSSIFVFITAYLGQSVVSVFLPATVKYSSRVMHLNIFLYRKLTLQLFYSCNLNTQLHFGSTMLHCSMRIQLRKRKTLSFIFIISFNLQSCVVKMLDD